MMKKKTRVIPILAILLMLAALALPFNGSKADGGHHHHSNKKHSSDNSLDQIDPQAGNGCGTDFLIDAPWRIDPSSTIIPLVLEIKDANYGCAGFSLDVGWNDPMYIEVHDYMGGPGVAETNRPLMTKIGPFTGSAFESVSNDTKFYHFSVPVPSWWTTGNTYIFYAKFRYKEKDLFFDDDAYFMQALRIYYSPTKLPRFANESTGGWYYGDVHWHGQWTDNENESGGSYRFLARAANTIGIDWSFVTEHASNSFQIFNSDPRDVGYNEWPNVKQGIDEVNALGHFKLFPGEEIDVKQEVDGGQSFYMYGNNKRYPATGSLNIKYENGKYIQYDGGILGDSPSRNHILAVPSDGNYVDGKLDKYGGATKYLDDMLANLHGIAYLAHGTMTSTNSIIGDMVPASPRQLNTLFHSQQVIGTEPWNEDNEHGTDGGNNIVYTADNDNVIEVNPFKWNATAKLWEWSYNMIPQHSDKSDEVLGHWLTLLQKGLQEKVDWAAATPDYYRKMFFAGGSDSHGDVNYKSYGNLYNQLGSGVMGWNSIQDSGFAEPRNLVLAPSNTQSDITAQLKKGRYIITNGPIIDIGIDLNNDGKLTEGTDYRVGDTGDMAMLQSTGHAVLQSSSGLYAIPVLVHYRSTAEFGTITTNNIEIIGRDSDGTAIGSVYLSKTALSDGSYIARYNILVKAQPKGYGGLDPGLFFFARVRTHVTGPTLLHDREFDGMGLTNPIWIRYKK